MAINSTDARALIQETIVPMLVEPLQAASVVLEAGPTIIDSSAPVRVPTLEDVGDPGWVGENELISDTDTVNFGEIELLPTERKSIKTITRVSNELIRAATQNVSTILETRLVNDVRKKLDDGLLLGTGADNTITGIFNQPGTTKLAYNPVDPDSYLDALAAASAAEATPTTFFVNGSDFYRLRKIKDNNGRYIMTGGPAEGVPYALHGTNVVVSNKVPAGKAALLNIKDVVVVRDVDPRVTLLNERYAEYDQVGIRVVTRYDLGLLRPSTVYILQAAAGA